MKNLKFKCTYTSGSGKEYDGGDWEVVTDTKKSLILKRIRKEFFEGISEDILKLKKDNKGKHCLKVWGDKTFTVYPYRNGTPYYFEPLDKPLYINDLYTKNKLTKT